MSERVYTVNLGEIAPGVPFMMVNYNGVFIRVKTVNEYGLMRNACLGRKEFPFNDDGHHVPIVELATGCLFFMAKQKPCLVYPGEDYTRKAHG